MGVITRDLTFQSDSLRAVEVQQGGEGAAICVVLQQVFHQGERWSVPLLDMLPPVASLKTMATAQRHRLYSWRHCSGNVGFLNVADTLSSACTCESTHTPIGECYFEGFHNQHGIKVQLSAG